MDDFFKGPVDKFVSEYAVNLTNNLIPSFVNALGDPNQYNRLLVEIHNRIPPLLTELQLGENALLKDTFFSQRNQLVTSLTGFYGALEKAEGKDANYDRTLAKAEAKTAEVVNDLNSFLEVALSSESADKNAAMTARAQKILTDRFGRTG